LSASWRRTGLPDEWEPGSLERAHDLRYVNRMTDRTAHRSWCCLVLAPLVAALAFTGCGARTGLAEPFAADLSASDAGATRDSGRTGLDDAHLTDVIASDAGSSADTGGGRLVGRVVLFGGSSAGSTTLDDTWVWDGASWSQRTPQTRPSARFFASAGQQSLLGVLFGGVVTFDGGGNDAADTWAWNGITWSAVGTVTAPSARDQTATAAVGATLMVFGGYRYGQVFGDTWIWNGSAWSQWASSGPAPSYRWGSAAASLGANAVLFGGRDGATNYNVADTWTFDGTAWSQSPASGPGARLGHAMATLGSSIVLFGGFVNGDNGSWAVGDTWIWNGASWTESKVPGPSARSGHMMATLGSNVILFGGVGVNGTLFDDTWLWNGSTWTQAAGSGPPARSNAAMTAYLEAE